MSKSVIQRKITVKGISGGPAFWFKKVIELDGAPLPVAKIVGTVFAAKPGASDFGEFIKLSGSFNGLNLLNGERQQSAACIMPNFIADGIYAALQDHNVNGVDFAVEVQVKYDVTTPTKYSYEVVNLIEMGTSDRMQKLLEVAGMSASVTALPTADSTAVESAPAKSSKK